jgi:RNase P subunit RPR2
VRPDRRPVCVDENTVGPLIAPIHHKSEPTMRQWKRIQCDCCMGLGRLSGTPARAGTSSAVRKHKLRICSDCGGNGYFEIDVSKEPFADGESTPQEKKP